MVTKVRHCIPFKRLTNSPNLRAYPVCEKQHFLRYSVLFFPPQIPRKSVTLKDTLDASQLHLHFSWHRSRRRERDFSRHWHPRPPERSTCSLGGCREGIAPVPETAAAHKLHSERGRGLCDPRGEGFASCRSNSSSTSVKWRRLEGFQGLLGGWRGSEAGDGCQRLRASPSAAA